MSDITQDDVIEYKMGRVTNPQLRQAIEHAREFDPLVRHWFSLTKDEDREPLPALFREIGAELARWVFPEALKPAEPFNLVVPSENGSEGGSGCVIRTSTGFRAEVRIECPLVADPGPSTPTVPRPKVFPSHEINQQAGVIRLTYLASDIPYGVARVTSEIDGTPAGEAIVVFRIEQAGGQDVRQADVGLTNLGFRPDRNAGVVYVVPATEENLAEFPIADVRKLGDNCNGDWEVQETIEIFVRRLEQGGQS